MRKIKYWNGYSWRAFWELEVGVVITADPAAPRDALRLERRTHEERTLLDMQREARQQKRPLLALTCGTSQYDDGVGDGTLEFGPYADNFSIPV